MKTIYSPLRYPGGKSKLSKFIAEICIKNDINGCYVEPYAGGASVGLYLLMEGYVSKIIINDIDRSIYAFWFFLLKHTSKFCTLIRDTDVNIKTWEKYREVQKNKNKANLLDLGFSTFFLNRTNISGILDAGVIGGLNQKGKYKMDCRYNKKALIQRVKRIAKYKKNIELYNMDALDLVSMIKKRSNNNSTIFYFDPPYYLKGPSLYLNYYDKSDHELVAKKIKEIVKMHWVVSYDNVEEIKKMYSRFRQTEYSLVYTANNRKMGSEILFFSPNLLIPNCAIL